jgi:hypothetical protein
MLKLTLVQEGTRPKYGFKFFSTQSGPRTEGGIMYFHDAAPQVQTGRCSWNFAKSFVTEQVGVPKKLALPTFGFPP